MKIIACIWGLGLVILLGVSGWQWRTATHREEDAQSRLVSTIAQIERLNTLRSSDDRVSIAPRPDGDVVSRVNTTLKNAKLPTSRLRSVDPQPDSAVRGPQNGLRQQIQRITLEPMGLSEFGLWLAAWQSQAGPWTIAGVDLSRKPRARPEDTDAYRLSITLSAVYLPDRVGGEQ